MSLKKLQELKPRQISEKMEAVDSAPRRPAPFATIICFTSFCSFPGG